MDFRAGYGEKITGESWVMRDIWQTTNIDYGAKWGLATCPKKLKSSGIKIIIVPGMKRHQWKAAHGFRKFYKSRTEQVMKPINIELTMGHDIGISASYYKPTEREVLEDYLKAVDLLTINSDKVILQKQVLELKEKSKDSEYIIKAKLQDKDNEIENMKGQMVLMQQTQKEILDLLKDPAKLLEVLKDI